MIETQIAGGVVMRGNLVLVASQRGTSWSLPKGHVEEGEDNITAAKREIYEESGITNLEFVKELGNYQRYRIDPLGGEDKNEFKTINISLFHTDEIELKPVDPENPEARWIEKDKVADLLTHPKDKEFFLSVINVL